MISTCSSVGRCRMWRRKCGGGILDEGFVPGGTSSVQAVVTHAQQSYPRAGGADVGRRCSGCASGVLGAVDRWLSGPASHSSAQAALAQTLRGAGGPERELQIDADVGR